MRARKSCTEFTLFYTPRGVILAHRARFAKSVSRNDGAHERKRVCVRFGPLLDACAIARHPERRVSMAGIQRLKIPTHAGISARFTYSTAIPRFHPIKRQSFKRLVIHILGYLFVSLKVVVSSVTTPFEHRRPRATRRQRVARFPSQTCPLHN